MRKLLVVLFLLLITSFSVMGYASANDNAPTETIEMEQ
ncbi:hypothetical protein DFR57_101434 [Saliterribacillus persicus]|uniref:Uncharacterized protein n=1 Tax=Saliterribacillus persicus TaxID=930114 RepID=A0A368YFB7_9BACI|nr:hypothetical protein DFR57_101434 [Saliterribacillus persicus]